MLRKTNSTQENRWCLGKLVVLERRDGAREHQYYLENRYCSRKLILLGKTDSARENQYYLGGYLVLGEPSGDHKSLPKHLRYHQVLKVISWIMYSDPTLG